MGGGDWIWCGREGRFVCIFMYLLWRQQAGKPLMRMDYVPVNVRFAWDGELKCQHMPGWFLSGYSVNFGEGNNAWVWLCSSVVPSDCIRGGVKGQLTHSLLNWGKWKVWHELKSYCLPLIKKEEQKEEKKWKLLFIDVGRVKADCFLHSRNIC